MATGPNTTKPPTAPPRGSLPFADRWAAWGPRLLSVLRIVAAFMFMAAGTRKLFVFPVGASHHGGPVHLLSEAGMAGVLEAFGGGLLLAGLFTRPVAFVLAGEMAVAYFQVHAPRGFWPTVNGGQSAAFYCFLWLYLSAAGGGPWSLDALRRRRSRAADRVGDGSAGPGHP